MVDMFTAEHIKPQVDEADLFSNKVLENRWQGLEKYLNIFEFETVFCLFPNIFFTGLNLEFSKSLLVQNTL